MGDYNDELRRAKIFASEMQRKQSVDLSIPLLLLFAVFSKRYRPRAMQYVPTIAAYFGTLIVIGLMIGVIAWL